MIYDRLEDYYRKNLQLEAAKVLGHLGINHLTNIGGLKVEVFADFLVSERLNMITGRREKN